MNMNIILTGGQDAENFQLDLFPFPLFFFNNHGVCLAGYRLLPGSGTYLSEWWCVVMCGRKDAMHGCHDAKDALNAE